MPHLYSVGAKPCDAAAERCSRPTTSAPPVPCSCRAAPTLPVATAPAGSHPASYRTRTRIHKTLQYGTSLPPTQTMMQGPDALPETRVFGAPVDNAQRSGSCLTGRRTGACADWLPLDGAQVLYWQRVHRPRLQCMACAPVSSQSRHTCWSPLDSLYPPLSTRQG